MRTGKLLRRIVILLATALAAGPALAGAPADVPNRDDKAPATSAATAQAPGFADLADLTESAPLILIAQIRSVARLEPARAGNVREGWARLYIQALPQDALRGAAPDGAIKYLADVPLDARGKPPMLKKQLVLLFARHVDGTGAIQLVAADAQLLLDASLEARAKAMIAAIAAPDAPGSISAVREAIYVPGTLAGEGETQIFLATASGTPASISVEHHAGRPSVWSASFSEVVDPSGLPPARDTLAWYRLACFLPPVLPETSNVSASGNDRAAAEADYRLVLAQLGPCGRHRH